MSELEQRIKKLRIELKELEDAYYSGRQELTSDDLYDYKLRELVTLERQHPELITPDSPTQKVGFSSSTEINVEHEVPMLSLNNAFNKDDLDNYFKACEKADENNLPEYILEPKIDGVSISIIYEDGYLKKAISRGDGEWGEDLTSKVLYVEDLPIRINGVDIPKRIVLRGEIYIRKSDFKSIQESQSFANPRNYVSGTLRLKEPEKLKNKKIRICIYQILYPETFNITKQSEVLETVVKWGFKSHEHYEILKDKERIWEYIEEFGKKKNDLDIPIDGLVLKVNQISLLDEIGFTSKFPKWAVAYKYPALIRESKLLEIFPTVGRTGKITYSAHIEPVEIDGSVVRYATLHNADYIRELDLRIGDYVGVYKSGEVVPKIVGYNIEKRDPNSIPWELVKNCPSCNSLLEERDQLRTQYCNNEDCIEKKYARLAHWCSREGADIAGLSTQITIKLNKLGVLNEIPDIYRLHEHKEKIIEGGIKIKEKSFNNLIEAIEKSKNREWRYLLFGLGINFIGEETAFILSKKYKSIQELMNASFEEIKEINGIGEKSAESLVSWFNENKCLIDKLISIGLFKPSENTVEVIESFLNGKKVVITGKLSRSRIEFSQLLTEKYGAIVQSEVSSKTDYLIAGEDAGSKLKKAEEKGITVLTEENLLKRLELL